MLFKLNHNRMDIFTEFSKGIIDPHKLNWKKLKQILRNEMENAIRKHKGVILNIVRSCY